MNEPGYRRLLEAGELAERSSALGEHMLDCRLCPRECGARRSGGETGYCGLGTGMIIGSVNLHHGEEPPLSGDRGSGTVFFSGCTMGCAYCQNYPLSRLRNGKLHSPAMLADELLRLQRLGAHNVNLVTGTQFLPGFVQALESAAERGFGLPVVMNTSGYERLETLRLLEGIVDIYLPDIRYSDNSAAVRFSGVGDYVETNRSALEEMHRQVGHLVTDESGIGVRGLIVRHLVLPSGAAGSEASLRWLMDRFGPGLHLSLMGQYFPAGAALGVKPLDRRITAAEYEAVVDLAEELGFENGWTQEYDDLEPD